MDAHERALPEGVQPLAAGDPPAVGPYTLLGRLGTGGMGVVYLGASPDPDGPPLVAVKTLLAVHTENPQARQRFRTEAAHAKRVASFCTARVIADGSDRASPYLVTEFIEGPPLSDVVEQGGPLPPDALAAVAIGTADALASIHAAGIVHRDLKPANVLLARSGPRIIDFGIAHTLDGPGGPTQAGIVMGSPGWIAPERLVGGPATPASDVFCWGLLVAYAATGRQPYGTGDAAALAERILKLPPDLAGMREPLQGLAAAATARDPALRPSAEDLLAALLGPRAEPTAALAVAELWEPPEHEYGPRPEAAGEGAANGRGRRLRHGMAAAGAALAAVLAAGAFMSLNPGAEAQQPPGEVRVTVTTTVGPDGVARVPGAGKGVPGAPGASGVPSTTGPSGTPGTPGPPSPGAPDPDGPPPGSASPTTSPTGGPVTQPPATPERTPKGKGPKAKPSKSSGSGGSGSSGNSGSGGSGDDDGGDDD